MPTRHHRSYGPAFTSFALSRSFDYWPLLLVGFLGTMPLSSPSPCPPQCYGEMNQLPGSGLPHQRKPMVKAEVGLAWGLSLYRLPPTPSASHRVAVERGFLQAKISI